MTVSHLTARGGVGPIDTDCPPADRRDVAALVTRVQAFVREAVIPLETEVDPRAHGPDDALRAELQAQARAAGVFAPTVPEDLGGLGLDLRAQAPVLEAAGFSLLGPLALGCAAPDEGNIALLLRVADAEQRRRWLEPLAAGAIRSCFAMTEPAPGAGSDPTMLRTTARRDGSDWVLDGEKWFITGADGAAVAIVVARTAGELTSTTGATLFLLDMAAPGLRLERVVPTSDRISPGGHAHLHFEGCRVGAEAVLGEVGWGYRYAQWRLGPARLTHCMRWLGIGVRALEVASGRAAGREAFGARIADLGMAQAQIADSLIDLQAARLLVADAARLLDAGEDARDACSMAKVFTSEAVFRVVDRAIQLCGSLGVADESQLARYLAEVRPFRIYDGPNEAHRYSIARRAVRAVA